MGKGNAARREGNGRKSPVARVFNAVNRPQTHRSVRDYRRVRLNIRDFR